MFQIPRSGKITGSPSFSHTCDRILSRITSTIMLLILFFWPLCGAQAEGKSDDPRFNTFANLAGINHEFH